MPQMTETYVLTTMLLILQGLQFTTLQAQVNPDLRGQVRTSLDIKLKFWKLDVCYKSEKVLISFLWLLRKGDGDTETVFTGCPRSKVATVKGYILETKFFYP